MALTDCETFVTLAAKPASGWLSLFARYDYSTGNGYRVALEVRSGTDRVHIQKEVNGDWTLLGSYLSQEFSDGDKLGLSVAGDTITAYRYSGGSWEALGSRTDGTHTAAGYLAVGIPDTGTRLDDFGGGSVGDPEPTVTPTATATQTPTDTPTPTVTPTPGTGLLDDFNRANGGLGSNWFNPAPEYFADVQIHGNAAANSSTGTGLALWDQEFPGDQEVYLTISALSATNGDYLSLVLALDAEEGTGYEVEIKRSSGTWSSWKVYRWDPDGGPVLAQATAAVALLGAISGVLMAYGVSQWIMAARPQFLTATDIKPKWMWFFNRMGRSQTSNKGNNEQYRSGASAVTARVASRIEQVWRQPSRLVGVRLYKLGSKGWERC